VNVGWNTEDARVFILPATGPNSVSGTGFPVYLSDELLNSFEDGDRRRLKWVDSVIVNSTNYYYPFKYKSALLGAPVTEYLTVFRLAEQYIIRAEARAKQNNIDGAKSDMNMIRTRAGLKSLQMTDQASLLLAIQHERQIELFTEWGHRWLDLKRNNTVNEVMGTVAVNKGSTWNPDWQWYPLPAYDLVHDKNLSQNHGY